MPRHLEQPVATSLTSRRPRPRQSKPQEYKRQAERFFATTYGSGATTARPQHRTIARLGNPGHQGRMCLTYTSRNPDAANNSHKKTTKLLQQDPLDHRPEGRPAGLADAMGAWRSSAERVAGADVLPVRNSARGPGLKTERVADAPAHMLEGMALAKILETFAEPRVALGNFL